jgi:hypothetical protein
MKFQLLKKKRKSNTERNEKEVTVSLLSYSMRTGSDIGCLFVCLFVCYEGNSKLPRQKKSRKSWLGIQLFCIKSSRDDCCLLSIANQHVIYSADQWNTKTKTIENELWNILLWVNNFIELREREREREKWRMLQQPFQK